MLTDRSLAILLAKTAGIVLITYSISLIPQNFNWYAQEFERSILNALLVGLGPVILPLSVGLGLFLLPATITAKFFDRSSVSVDEQQSSSSELELVVFSGIGLYLTVMAILDLVYLSLHLTLLRAANFELRDFPPETTAGFVAAALQMAFGSWLLLRSKGLVALLRRIRQ